MSFVETRQLIAEILKIDPRNVSDDDLIAYLKSGPGVPDEHADNEALNKRLLKSNQIRLAHLPKAGKHKTEESHPDSFYEHALTKAEK